MTLIANAASARLLHNSLVDRGRAYGGGERAVLSEEKFEQARREVVAWPGYAETPLVRLPGLAAEAGVADILYKDEAGRFGLGSFKALGGAYAVFRLLADRVAEKTGGAAPDAAALAGGDYRDITSAVTVCCATDGNHGRSVAWGARTFGCRATIYIHETVSDARRDAIAGFGAEVVRTPGNYDDSVRQAAADAAENGWHVVSDTSYDGYMDVPRDVMQGYTVMTEEAIRQLPGGRPPTHIFVQGGVGGLAAAVLAPFWQRYGADRPRFLVVEPERAACLYDSAEAGRPVAADGDLDTVMAGLACGEVSLLAWQILAPGADDFMTVTDDAALDVMRLLADGTGGNAGLVAGESAVAGLAGALAALARPEFAERLALGRDSRILVFGTEGDTDPALYKSIVGRSAEAVRKSSN